MKYSCKSNAIMSYRYNWPKIAELASKKCGRIYSAQYCRDVFYKLRTSTNLQKVINDLIKNANMSLSHAIDEPVEIRRGLFKKQ
jgi:hypothetical protein